MRFVDRIKDGTTSYAVEVPNGLQWRGMRAWKTIGRVVKIRPGVWMAEGSSLEFPTRQEAAEYLVVADR